MTNTSEQSIRIANISIFYTSRSPISMSSSMARNSGCPPARECVISVSVYVSASYCIPQCVRLIAGVCTHYVVYNISKKKNTVDKSKIKER